MTVSYRRAFWKSRHHAWLAALTLGAGFVTGEPLGLLIGVVLYAVGWIFLPDAGFFRRAVDARENAAREKEIAAKWAEFQAQQERLMATLSNGRRTRYNSLLTVCRDIEAASTDAQAATGLEVQSRTGKLDELLWTFLRMLAVEQTLEVYLEGERKEQVPQLTTQLEGETQALTAEITALKQKTPPPASLDTKQRLLTSRLERLETLRQRQARIDQAQANLELVRSEEERLIEQVKLIRADAVAAKNADALSARIDLSIQHLAATNQWLSEIAEFKEVSQQMPELPSRVGLPPPPLPRSTATPQSNSQT